MSATLADRERREKDATERHGAEVDIRLDHVMSYHIPCLWAKLELAHKDQVRASLSLYNPLSNEIKMPVVSAAG